MRRPINDPLNHVRAWLVVGLYAVVAPNMPNNEGAHRVIHVSAPVGSILNPTETAPVFWRIASGTLVTDLFFKVLGEAAPDRVLAGAGNLPCVQFYLSGVRRSGAGFMLHQHAFGGMGGRPGADGPSGVGFPYSVRAVSTEGSEIETPLFFVKCELNPDSAGPGMWRGGLGEELVITTVPGGDADPVYDVVFAGTLGRFQEPPHGLFGGHPGACAEILVDGKPKDPASLGSSPEVHFAPDQRLTLRLPGGGGYDAPAKRKRDLVRSDVTGGYISAESARRDYGNDEGD